MHIQDVPFTLEAPVLYMSGTVTFTTLQYLEKQGTTLPLLTSCQHKVIVLLQQPKQQGLLCLAAAAQKAAARKRAAEPQL